MDEGGHGLRRRTRTQKADGCPAGDPCIGPYVVAYDQATGELAFATQSIDSQPGADVYGSPVFHDGLLLHRRLRRLAELGDEADRYAFQGSMSFLDAATGRLLKKTWTIHPPKQPDDEFAGAGVWSTPAIDPEEQVAYAGTANPFKPQAEHKLRELGRQVRPRPQRAPKFGEIIGHYKGNIDEYFPASPRSPCHDIPGNPPPYYPQGIGSCGDIDLDFGASPNLFKDEKGRKLVGAGQKSGVYHVFDAKTMKPVWTQIVGPPGALGGIVGSTAHDGKSVYGPITAPGYMWSIDSAGGAHRWFGPIADGAHWGPPVAVANGLVYSVDFSGFLDVFDARNGALLVGGRWPWAAAARLALLGRREHRAEHRLRRGGRARPRRRLRGGLPAGQPLRPAGRRRETPGGDRRWRRRAASARRAARRSLAGPGARLDGLRDAGDGHAGGRAALLPQPRRRAARRRGRTTGPGRTAPVQQPLIGLGETAPVEGLDSVQAGRHTPSTAACTRA